MMIRSMSRAIPHRQAATVWMPGRYFLSTDGEQNHAVESSSDAPAAAEVKAKRLHKDSDGRRLKKKEQYEAKLKTELCEDHERGTCDLGSACRYAHGLRELRSPPYFQQALEVADGEGRPVTASDLVHARIDSVLKRSEGYNEAVKGLRVKSLGVFDIRWCSDTLQKERYVEKISIEMNVELLAKKWCLSPMQALVLKRVVGPRYDKETDTFTLTRRNKLPSDEILDDEVVHDDLIVKLCQIVKEVKTAVPEQHELQHEDDFYTFKPLKFHSAHVENDHLDDSVKTDETGS